MCFAAARSIVYCCLEPARDPFQPAEEMSQSTEFRGFLEILRITPFNLKAKVAFDQLAKNRDHLDRHHAQYIVLGDKGFIIDGEVPIIRPDDESPNEDSSERPTKIAVQLGFFSVSFDLERTFKGPKWILGRGSSKHGERRGVDILLAMPKTKTSENVAAAHAMLHVHPRSGAWILSSGPSAVPFTLDDKAIKPGNSCCLSKFQSKLVVAGMEFSIEFFIKNEERETDYCDLRDTVFRNNGMAPLITRISGIPFESDIHLQGHVVYRTGLGRGTFGLVSEGFHPQSGNLRAVKEIVIQSESDVAVTKRELDAHTLFGESIGIIRDYGWYNASGQAVLFAKNYPLRIYLALERGEAFDNYNWTAVTWTIKRKLLCQLIRGLATIHEHGAMHRDINPKNMIYFGDDERACLSDLGKVVMETSHTSRSIAGKAWLPPEVANNDDQPYNRSVDIFMLAYALIYTWYPDVMRQTVVECHTKQILPSKNSHHKSLIKNLGAKRGTTMVEILIAMIAWDSSNRPTARHLLEVPEFKQILKGISNNSSK